MTVIEVWAIYKEHKISQVEITEEIVLNYNVFHESSFKLQAFHESVYCVDVKPWQIKYHKLFCSSFDHAYKNQENTDNLNVMTKGNKSQYETANESTFHNQNFTNE